jgi:hypothetical protein
MSFSGSLFNLEKDGLTLIPNIDGGAVVIGARAMGDTADTLGGSGVHYRLSSSRRVSVTMGFKAGTAAFAAAMAAFGPEFAAANIRGAALPEARYTIRDLNTGHSVSGRGILAERGEISIGAEPFDLTLTVNLTDVIETPGIRPQLAG